MKAYKKYFYKNIEEMFGKNAGAILEELNTMFLEIEPDVEKSKNSKNLLDERLSFAAYFLALVKVLKKRGNDFQSIESLCLKITYDYVKPKNQLVVIAKKLPVKLLKFKFTEKLLKKFDERINTLGYAEGFRAEVVTNKEKTFGLGYGINILECGICKLFAKHGASDLVSILCSVDNVTSAVAGLDLIRTGTIANGQELCDFRFKIREID